MGEASNVVLWTHGRQRPETAPLDGSPFMAVPKGKTSPIRAVFDDQMGCFLGEGFEMFDRLASWWPLRPARSQP